MSFVLDASALLALLRGEPGAERVGGELAAAVMSTVNVAEVVGHYAKRGTSAADIGAMLDPLPFERVDFDHELAMACGLMQPATSKAGLSLADRACLALAGRLGAPAMTADKAWSLVAAEVGVTVELIR